MTERIDYFCSDSKLFSYSGNVSYGFSGQVPIVTLSSGASLSYLFTGDHIVIHFYSYYKTGNVLIYIDGAFYARYSLGVRSNYTSVDYSISDLTDGNHSLMLIAEGNYVSNADNGRDSISNVVVSSVNSYATVNERAALQDFTFIFVCGVIFSLLAVSIFRLFGIFGGRN